MGKKKGRLPKDRAEKAAPDNREQQAAFFTNFAQNVRNRRESLQMTQIEMAHRAGLARSYVNRLENAEEPLSCNLYAAYRIAKALGCSLMTLCE